MFLEKSAKGCFKGEMRIAGQREKGRPRMHADMGDVEVEAKYAPQLRRIQKQRCTNQERK